MEKHAAKVQTFALSSQKTPRKTTTAIDFVLQASQYDKVRLL